MQGELILPNGEMSDTLIYDMAVRANEDGRAAVVLYFSDFDPSGHAMPANVARKLLALTVEEFPDLGIEVHAVALTLEQVGQYALPSTPLKDTERRADRWREVMGHEQTEIDALAALRPEVLRSIARDAVAPFFDFGLSARARLAQMEWHEKAEAMLHEHPDYVVVCEEISTALDDVRAALDNAKAADQRLREVQRQGVERLRLALPPIEQVQPVLHKTVPEPLFTTDDDFADATRRLVEYKKLNGNGRD